MNIFVGNLSREATQENVKEAFEAFGQVSSVAIIKDKITGEPRGFGFVEMPSQKEAEAAINGVREIAGRAVTVNEARPREGGPRGGGFGGGRPGGGNRGGRGGGGKSGW